MTQEKTELENVTDAILNPNTAPAGSSKELRLKALRVIEGLTFPDIVTPDAEKLSQIYKFAHIAVGTCSNKHEDWINELDEAEQALIRHGVIGE